MEMNETPIIMPPPAPTEAVLLHINGGHNHTGTSLDDVEANATDDGDAEEKTTSTIAGNLSKIG